MDLTTGIIISVCAGSLFCALVIDGVMTVRRMVLNRKQKDIDFVKALIKRDGFEAANFYIQFNTSGIRRNRLDKIWQKLYEEEVSKGNEQNETKARREDSGM